MSKRLYGGLDNEFWAAKPLIGMVHLMPLPGSARDAENTLEVVIERAISDAKSLEAGGADAIMIENFFDAPFVKEDSPPHAIASMTRAVLAVRNVVNLPLGVNVLRNDSFSAIAIAHVCGAQFVRVNVWVGAAVTDQGVIEGAARKAILYRKELGADVAIFADIFVKHATQLASGSLEDAAKDAVLRGLADGLSVSGTTTGASTPPTTWTSIPTRSVSRVRYCTGTSSAGPFVGRCETCPRRRSRPACPGGKTGPRTSAVVSCGLRSAGAPGLSVTPSSSSFSPGPARQ